MVFAGLLPRLGVAEIVQERLGSDGFPADWKASDFAIGTVVVSRSALPTSGTDGGRRQAAAGFENVGVLTAASGGIAADVWQKTARGGAEQSLERGVAQGVASPALKEAWRRVLLSEGAPPPVQDKGVRPNWLAVRAGALEKLGLYEAAWGLWQKVPQAALTEDALAKGWVEASLLAGHDKDACAVAKARATENAQDWGAAMAVCQLMGNGANMAAAGLSLQIVEPLLKAKNPALLRILTAVQDGRPVASVGGPGTMVDGLGGAVLAAYPALAGAEILPRLPDVALRRMVGSQSLPADLRGRAAVALARQTGLPQDGARAWELVSTTQFTGALPDAVVMARGDGVSGTESGIFVQAALRLGQTAQAVAELPHWKPVPGENANDTRMRLQAQLAAGALQGKVEETLWDAWMVAQPLDVQSGVRQAQRTLLTVEGLGMAVPPRIWQQMRDRAVPVSTMVDPAWQRLLAGAVRDRDVPQVLSLISDAWGGQPPAGAVPVVMGASVEALRRIGMDDLARRVAAEAMLGIPASHLIPLAPQRDTVSDERGTVSGTAPVGVSASSVERNDGIVLPPPRVMAPIKKPTVKAPLKPVAPKMSVPR